MPLSVMNGKEIFVTSGSTRAYLDAMMYLSNRSSGRLGAEIAAECLRRGAYVSYFHGKGAITPVLLQQGDPKTLEEDDFSRLDMIEIETVPQLAGAIERELKEGYYDAAIHAMAVLDYVPDLSTVLMGTTRKERTDWDLKLVPTPSIAEMIKRISPETTLVGFCADVNIDPEKLKAGAQELMEKSGAEIVVANDLAHLKQTEYQGVLVDRDPEGGGFRGVEIQGRAALAKTLCDRLEDLLKAKAE